jgi:SMC interacting uncharacterized protein involved in chromosome segregation
MDKKQDPRRQAPTKPTARPAARIAPKSKDPRPLSDREYISGECKRIIEFLVVRRYPHPISLPLLSSANLKEFWKIADFISKQIEPSFNCRTEEEVQSLANMLKYPYPITKQAMAGATHLWGQLIGFLSWLQDLTLILAKDIEIKLNRTQDHIFAEFAWKAYALYLTDAPRIELWSEYRQQIAERSQVQHEDLDDMRKRVEVLKIEKKSIKIDDGLEYEEMEEFLESEVSELLVNIGRLEQTKKDKQYTLLSTISKILQYLKLPKIPEDILQVIKQKTQYYEERAQKMIQDRDQLERSICEASEQASCRAEDETEECTRIETPEPPELHQEIENLKFLIQELKEELEDTEDKLERSYTQNAAFGAASNAQLEATRALMLEDSQVIARHAENMSRWLDQLIV